MGAIDVTARAMRSVSCGDEGLNANDGVAARTKARAAAEILEGLMALLGSGRGMASMERSRNSNGLTHRPKGPCKDEMDVRWPDQSSMHVHGRT